MPTSHPRLEALPEIFPVFPLSGALLLPGGQLPLNIFEPRYLAMVEDALAFGRVFGMIQPDYSQQAGDTGPALFRIGCLGRLTSFSETDDGRYLITLTGLTRFEVVSEAEMRRGYRRVQGDFHRFSDDLRADPQDGDVGREALLQALRQYFTHRGFSANWELIEAMPDPELVTNLAMVCPFDPLEKQALLEAANLVEQATTLKALLQIDTHEPPTTPDAAKPNRRLAS